MPISRCRASHTDLDGVNHAVEVEAQSLYEARLGNAPASNRQCLPIRARSGSPHAYPLGWLASTCGPTAGGPVIHQSTIRHGSPFPIRPAVLWAPRWETRGRIAEHTNRRTIQPRCLPLRRGRTRWYDPAPSNSEGHIAGSYDRSHRLPR
jgi:hypothetical protein